MPALSAPSPSRLAVVVHVREAAQQVAVLVAERADAELVGAAAHAGQQVEPRADAPALAAAASVVRPQLVEVLGLPGVHDVQGVDHALAARVVAARSTPARWRGPSASSTSRWVDVTYDSFAAQLERAHDVVGVVSLPVDISRKYSRAELEVPVPV